MKKLVPDPPCQIPFVTIISDLGPDEAVAYANRLMDTFSATVSAWSKATPDTRLDVLMDSAHILAELIVALIRHARSKGAPV